MATGLPASNERRSDARYPGFSLSAEIDGRACAIENVSIGGLLLAGAGLPVGTPVRVRIFGPAFPTEGIVTECLTRRSGPEWTALQFQTRTYPLMQAIIRHLSCFLGQPPHIF